MTRLLLTLLISFVPQVNADYASCILENMKGVGSDVAAEEIKAACLNIYPSDNSTVKKGSEGYEIEESKSSKLGDSRDSGIGIEFDRDTANQSETELLGFYEGSTCVLKESYVEIFGRFAAAEEQFLTSDQSFSSATASERVGSVLEELKREINEPCLEVRVHFTQTMGVERFSLPDGQMFLSAGLLAQVSGKELLKSFISHEMAHILILRDKMLKSPKTNSEAVEKSGSSKLLTLTASALVGTALVVSDLGNAFDVAYGVSQINEAAKKRRSKEDEDDVFDLQQSIFGNAQSSKKAFASLIDPITGRVDSDQRQFDAKQHPQEAFASEQALNASFELDFAVNDEFQMMLARKAILQNYPRYALWIIENKISKDLSDPDAQLIQALAYQKLDKFPLELSNRQRSAVAKNRQMNLGVYEAEDIAGRTRLSRHQMSNHNRALDLFGSYLATSGSIDSKVYFSRAQSHLVLSNVREAAGDLVKYVRRTENEKGKTTAVIQLRQLKEALEND